MSKARDLADFIADSTVATDEIADGAVTAGKLNVTGNGTLGQALTSDADGSFSWTTITSDLVDDTTPQLGGALDTNGNDINFGDNDNANFGAGNDLTIYHNSATGESFIEESGTGNLYVRGTNLRLQDTLGANYFSAQSGGESYLYHNGLQRVQVNTSGISVTGTVEADDIKLGDNERIQLGASQDLQIYHSGTNSYIDDSGTGNLDIRSQDLRLRNADGSSSYLHANNGGNVEVFYNGSKKLETTSSGVSVTGDMTLSSSGAVNSELRSDFAGLQLGTTSNHYLAFRTNNTERARIDTSGNMSVTGSVKTVNTAKAWVEFQGSGTVTVRNHFNISSVSDRGAGLYTLNFSDALANNNYAVVGVSSQAHELGIVAYDQTSPYTRTTSAVIIRNRRNANSTADADYISVVVYGDD